MTRLPKPEAGLVIRYFYLWRHEHLEGREEGVKDRPRAIVLATLDQTDRTQVVVVPVTHSQLIDPKTALELPAAVKRHLGLDSKRSWVVHSESNAFLWPGPDLRRIGDRGDGSVAYGMLPPRFFNELKQRFLKSGTTQAIRTE